MPILYIAYTLQRYDNLTAQTILIGDESNVEQ